MPGNPVLTLMGTDPDPGSEGRAPALRPLHAGVQPRPAALEAVLVLLGLALPRRPRHEHPPVPDAGDVDHHPRDPVHARPADPGDPAQLVRGQQGRRARRAPEGARQHGAAARLCADRDPVHVARDPARLAARRHLARLPGRLRLRPDGGRGLHLGLRLEPRSTTGSCRSCRSSSSPSAAGRSACGT